MYSIRKIISILRLVFILLLLLLNSCSDRSEFGTESDYIKLGADATVGGTDTTGDDNDTTVGGTDTTGDDNDTTEGATDTTEGASDTTAPTISSVSPTDNSTYKSPATTIAATFSEAMSTGTISTNTNDTTCSGSYQLSSDNFTTCIKMSAAPSSSNNATTFTATPTDNLSGGTIHKLKITTSAKDSSSNSLASTYTTNGFTTSPSGSGTITGTVKQGSSALSGVSVALSIYGTTVTTETSDSNGAFSQSSLGLGVYSLTYTKSGYLEAIQSGTLATDNQTLVVATQTMISDGCSDAGDISGTIKNAVTGDEIQGVAIILRNGLNTRSGNTISGKTATTDANGAYTLSSIDPGSYTIQGRKDNWISTYFNAISCSGLSNKNSNMSEKLADGAMRIVMSWEGTQDFDSHLEIPCTSGTCSGSNSADKSHLWYGVDNTTAATYSGVSTRDYHNYTDIVSSGDYVTLDQDNTNGTGSAANTGPETITISKLRSGDYRYHVHAYDKKGRNTTHIADNGTVVQVFYDVDQVINFDVPSTAGDLWTVFDYNKSTGFSTLNTMGSEGNSNAVDDH
jgi:hypothetical protein